jgi:hypothetical protein
MIIGRRRTVSVVALLGWAFFARFAASGMLVPTPQAAERKPCCFANVRYEGACVVQPAQGETCASILEYLNNPNTVGKTYCNGSRIRGGWRVVDCDAPRDGGSKP